MKMWKVVRESQILKKKNVAKFYLCDGEHMKKIYLLNIGSYLISNNKQIL